MTIEEADEARKTVSIAEAAGVSLDSVGKGGDRLVRCLSCSVRFFTVNLVNEGQAELGRVYSRRRRVYTLDTDAITSYELGSAGDDPDSFAKRLARVETDLTAELRKVQGVVLALHERLQRLEG